MNRESFRLRKPGSLNELNLNQEELAEPEENEVTVEVKAIGLNFADLFSIMGLYAAAPKDSFIPGLEYSGVVIKTGSAVKTVKVGDRIMGATRFGAYTTHINIDYRYIRPLPEGWSFEEGAGFIVQALTAYYALIPLGNLKKGQTVLIHSAAGGVGIYANRIAKLFSAYTIGSIGSPGKTELLKKEGYDQVIVRSGSFRQDLQKALGGRPLNLVLECIGGEIFKASYDALAPTGRVIVYGAANFMPSGMSPNRLKLFYQYLTRPKIDPIEMTTDNKSVLAFNLIWLWDFADEMNAYFDALISLRLPRPVIGHTFAFADTLKALQLFQSGKTIGKVVVKV
ncbi:MAG: zinc-binding dehydrogenase [Chlorobiales bacterium]|nr:zinc-binding dehydrogenase [Chlorobiales bacterium]